MLKRHRKAPGNARTAGALRSRQAGVTLLETLITLALSTLVITAMVVLMGNSMGTTNRITQMAQLNDELRNVMSMLTRDIRRANYSAASILCYGNPYCGEQPLTRQEGGDTPLGAHMVFAAGCVIFQVDRTGNLQNYDGDATNDSKGGFRLVDDDGVGVVQMWANTAATVPGCGDDIDAAGWIAVTDPNIVDIVEFTINDEDSFDKSIFQDDGESEYTQRQRHLQLTIEGELVLEQRMGWAADTDDQMIRRRIQDVIVVRNDYLWPPEPVAP